MDFLRTRYGNNLVSAHLHMDETSPQIHAVMVPITGWPIIKDILL
jgi:hypothetical protein